MAEPLEDREHIKQEDHWKAKIKWNKWILQNVEDTYSKNWLHSYEVPCKKKKEQNIKIKSKSNYSRDSIYII